MRHPFVEDAPVVLHRIYPAEVVLPTPEGEAAAVLTGVLVILTELRAYVWTAPDQLALSAPWDRTRSVLPPQYRLRRDPANVHPDQGLLVVNRGRGCGCNDPLKGYRPFRPEVVGKR